MLDAISRLLPPVNKFLEQIWPSVVATLIAAGLISGYNHAFSGHLQQPRMAALHEAAGLAAPGAPAPTTTVPKVKPAQETATEAVTIRDRTDEPARVLEKEASGELGKDQTAVKVAAPAPQPAPRPTNVANPVPRSEPRVVERRAEPRVTGVPYVVPPAPQAVTVAPMAPPLAAAPLPPPVIMAPPPVAAAQPMPPMPPMPDRPYQRPPYDAQAEDVPPPPPPRGPIGAIVDTLKPSSLFARAREFGQRIEDAGNDILPNIRQ